MKIGLLSLGAVAADLFTFWLSHSEIQADVQVTRTVEELFSLRVDLRLIPQLATGFPSLKEVIDAFENAGSPPTLVLLSRGYVASVPQLVQSSIHGVISYEAPLMILGHAIRLVSSGGRFVCQDLLDAQWSTVKSMRQQPPAHVRGQLPLTGREREVLSLVRLGNSNKRIAAMLGITESTVKLHVRQVMKKLNAENRTHAAILAGLLEST
jgi:DNA-binding NarL/FixJ family response regulator